MKNGNIQRIQRMRATVSLKHSKCLVKTLAKMKHSTEELDSKAEEIPPKVKQKMKRWKVERILEDQDRGLIGKSYKPQKESSEKLEGRKSVTK